MDIGKFRELPLLGILRGIEPKMVEPLLEAVVSSGLKTIEITMNTVGAPRLLRQTVLSASGKLVIGAGTVLSMADLFSALDAGATFIVLPVLVLDVVEYCAKNAIPVFPGAFTPQEIHNAWRAGATMVKVFPAGFLGPKYFKEIKGPFNDIELLACGGVTVDTIGAFFSCQASAVAFGGSVFKKEWLERNDFSKVKEAIQALIARLPSTSYH
jgi:2-dehydro-3-deoxyphosphogluconate aldolase / (4S)-4-hydroxy-2-oxoglutarate aldolase